MPTPAEIASLTASDLADAGLDLIVEHDEQRLIISGIVSTEAERAAALDIANVVAGDEIAIDDSIEVSGAMPDEAGGVDLSESEVAGFTGATPGLEDPETAMPRDFTDQDTIDAPALAQPMSMSDDGRPMGEEISRAAEDGETYVPPTDPVGTDTETIGGFARSSMDATEPERSSDGTFGDEAIREAIMRELREDAATTALEVNVEVIQGVAILTGNVSDILDAESAEEVAGRVNGVVEVRERLDVRGSTREPGGERR
jgi:osmotically-inducible protein OsmY